MLLVKGEPAAVGARAFDVLMALIDRRGRLVTKDELLDIAWQGRVVEENNLQVQISTLRKHLGAHAVVTIPGLGYRFALEPESAQDAAPRHNLPAQLNRF
ncbi:MAG TPA: winged helix-turn-helix domain-containing protein, partial [Usitatibacter sp.]|nr:winged helix-turn-helix domain-containing protein [Usitatibacter sp.]